MRSMGLDTVELVIAVEEEFSISIPNENASEMFRVGDLRDFVIGELRDRGETVDEARVWSSIQDIIVSQLGVARDDVTPEARFVEDLGAD